MFLTEEQAKANIKELVAYDGLKLISAEQENRIDNLKQQNLTYFKVVKGKDSIIKRKDEIIHLQDEIIKAKKSLEFHTYAGAQAFNLELNSLALYGKASLELEKFNIQAQINYSLGEAFNLPNVYYSINLEYKIF